MRKGMAYQMVVSIVLALIAIILIWYFHEKIFTFFKDTLLEGLKGFICNVAIRPIKWAISNC